MDNAQKAIMIGVGLFITIIIIAAVMLITGMGQNLLNKGQAQVSGISESLMNDLVAQYDGKKMSGAQVRTAAVQLVNRDDATITVEIGEKKFTRSAEATASSLTNSINSEIRTLGATSQFKGEVTSDNGAVTVKFTKI